MDSFWQFSDKLRLDLPGNAAGGVDDFSNSRWAFNSNSHLNHFSNISIGDSIWARTNDRTNENWPKDKSAKGKPEIDRNFDGKGKGRNTNNSEVNIFNDGWKFGGSSNVNSVNGRVAENPKVSKYNYNKNSNNNNNTSNGINSKNSTGKSNSNGAGGKSGKGGNAGVVDKRFKTLPPSESLPHSEPLGGYIFVCNNDTMEDDLRRQLFGLPQRYRDSVRAITPGLPLFLYNYSTHQLHGVFEAASFGGTNIDPTAWEDKKCPGESRFPAQVRIVTRKVCPPLEEDSFRPVLHHYDGPKFRLQLSIPEALDLLDIFEEKSSV